MAYRGLGAKSPGHHLKNLRLLPCIWVIGREAGGSRRALLVEKGRRLLVSRVVFRNNCYCILEAFSPAFEKGFSSAKFLVDL